MAREILPFLSEPARGFATSAAASYLVLGFPWLIFRSANHWTDPEVGPFIFLTLLISVGLFIPCSLIDSWILFKLMGPKNGFPKPFRAWATGTIAVLLLWNDWSWKIASLGYPIRGSYEMPLGLLLGFHMVVVSHLLGWALPPWRRSRLP